MEDADQNAIDGNGTPSDYDLLTGGNYSYNQDPYTANDNGTVNNATTGTGTASSKGTIPPPAGGSSYTPPSWLANIIGASTSVGNAYTTLSPLIGGKPAAGPSQAGAAPPASAKTVTAGTGSGFSTTTILVIVGAIAAAFFFLKRK